VKEERDASTTENKEEIDVVDMEIETIEEDAITTTAIRAEEEEMKEENNVDAVAAEVEKKKKVAEEEEAIAQADHLSLLDFDLLLAIIDR